jgi:hypothetical protein
MSENIEIVFEEINISFFINWIKKIDKNGLFVDEVIINLQKNLKEYFIDWDQIEKLLINEKDIAIFINAKKIIIDDINIDNISFQVIKYELKYDLNILFDSDSYKNCLDENEILKLYKLSKKISKLIKAKNYYAGIEPAIDIETRIFDINKIGPFIDF